MGLFSSDKIITVSATTLNMVAVSPAPFKDAVVLAIIKDENISSTLVKTLMNGVAINMRRVYAYARDYYTLGLPQGESIGYGTLNLNDIDDAIALDLGPVPIRRTRGAAYIDISPANYSLPYLIAVRGYNKSTNNISVYPPNLVWPSPVTDYRLSGYRFDVAAANKKVSLNSASVNIDGVSIDIVYDLWLEREVVEYTIDEYGNSIGNIVKQYVKEPNTCTENVPTSGLHTITWGEDYLIAYYREYDIDGVTAISDDIPWLYRVSSNTYPLLIPDITETTGDYLPVIPLRYNNKDLTAEAYHETPLYITSKELAKKAKLSLDYIAVKLNENPNVGEIDHAYVMYGVNLQTQHKESLRYLHTFFHNVYLEQKSDELEFLNKLGTPYYGEYRINSYLMGNFFDSEGSFDEYGLKLYLDYDYITSTYEAGTIGNGRLNNIEKEIVRFNYNIPFLPQDRGKLLLKLQAEPNVLHVISVYGLEVRNIIYKGEYVKTSILDVLMDDKENNLILPINYQLAETFSLRVRNALYADATLLVLNSYTVTTTEWYQSAFFKFILIIVIIVVSYFTGYDWGLSSLLATYEAAGMAGLMMALAEIAVVSIIINLAAQFLVKEFGAELGILGAIVLTIAAVVVSQGAGLFGEVSKFTMTTANLMLQGASALVSSANEFLLEEAQDIINEYVEFEAKLEDKYEELKILQDLVAMKAHLNPLTFASPARLKSVPHESPDQFFTRCLGLADNSMYPIHDEIPQFFSARLKLPKALPAEAYA